MFVICIKDRLPDRLSCLNIYPCVIKVQSVSQSVSLSLSVSDSFDLFLFRFCLFFRPLLSHKIAVLSRTVKIIVVIWIVSVLVALPYAVHTRLYHAVTWPADNQPVADSLVCSIPKEWLEGRMTYMFQVCAEPWK